MALEHVSMLTSSKERAFVAIRPLSEERAVTVPLYEPTSTGEQSIVWLAKGLSGSAVRGGTSR